MDGLDLTPEQLAYEAKEVQLLMKHRLVQAAFLETEQEIARIWERGKTVEEREAAFSELQGFRRWKRRLNSRPNLPTAKE